MQRIIYPPKIIGSALPNRIAVNNVFRVGAGGILHFGGKTGLLVCILIFIVRIHLFIRNLL